MTERYLFWGLVGFVGLTPLPLGSNRPWSWSLLALIAGLLILAWAVAADLRRAPAPIPARLLWPALLPYGLALAWAALQTATFTPVEWHHPAWPLAADALGMAAPSRISVDPYASWTTIMRLLAYGVVFYLAVQLCRARHRARHALLAVTLISGIYAVYGLAAQFSQTDTILWFHKWAYIGFVTSTFVNKNNYATYAGLGVLCATALLIELVERAVEFTPDPRLRLRQTITALTERGVYFVLTLVCLLTALLLSGSRGGLAATVAGLGILFLTFARTRGSSSRLLRSFGLIFAVVAVGLFLFSGEITAERFAEADAARPKVYSTVIGAIETNPLLGTGLGSFAEIFPLYQQPDIPGNWHEAHNTYLELALELGVPGTLLLALGTVVAALLCLRGAFRRRRDALYPALAVAATILIGSHALVDFSLQIPAVATTYAFLLGLGYAQSWRREELEPAAAPRSPTR
jgi:O-antigen ligase